MREIRKAINDKETRKLMENIQEIEDSKDDSIRMYKALKQINRNKPKSEIIVKNEQNRLTSNEKEAVEIIAKFFYEMFDGEETDLEHIKLAQMKVPFTETEVRKAINSLKNNKSAGIDDIKAEHLKYGTSVINKGIAKILNDTAKTGKYP